MSGVGAGRHERPAAMEDRMAERGKVKWFNENRGYGFIRRESGGNEVYVHYSDIEGEGFRTLSEGEIVEFEIAESERGLEARNVRKIQ